jgi:tRNA(Ile)-lysidine synthetase-like protein
MLYLVDGSNSLDLEVSYNMPDSGYLDIPGLNFSQSRSDVFEYLKKRDEGQSIELKFRQPTQSGITTPHSHSLKRLFQKNQIPPWKRSSIPQIFLNNELSALWLL